MNTMQSVIDPRTRTILTAYGGLETVTTQGVFDAQGVVDDFTKAFLISLGILRLALKPYCSG